MEKIAFVIMQIGNPELDNLYKYYIKPAVEAYGFDVKRVDKHNKGELLKSEIVQFIKESGIIIADLTNERPNCYLEIGYAMGLNKFNSLIMIVREDHHQDSPNYKREGSKIHFDLSGYDILRWWPDKLDEFNEELKKRIGRRLSNIKLIPKAKIEPWDEAWIKAQREHGNKIMQECNVVSRVEFVISIPQTALAATPKQLRDAAFQAYKETIDLSSGCLLGGNFIDDAIPTTDGIIKEIKGKNIACYLSLRSNGTFYLMESFFNNATQSRGGFIIEDRIERIAGVLIFIQKLYYALKASGDSTVFLRIRHTAIRDQTIASRVSRVFKKNYRTTQGTREDEFHTTLNALGSNLIDNVEYFTSRLFELFSFFELPKTELNKIIDNFANREIRKIQQVRNQGQTSTID